MSKENPNNVYVELRDKGTSFYDMSQGKGIKLNEVQELVLTPEVRRAISGNRLKVVEDEDAAKKKIAEQEKYVTDLQAARDKANGVAPAVSGSPASEESKDDTAEDAEDKDGGEGAGDAKDKVNDLSKLDNPDTSKKAPVKK